jgi:flagellar biosynthesis GTPase FlhF
MFGFEESLTLWEQNEKAIGGLAAAKLAYANEAYRKGDFDLGLSLLDRSNSAHQSLIEQLENGKKERLAKTARIALLRKATAAMLAFILIGGGVALYAIDRQRTAAETAKEAAEASTKLAQVETAKAQKAAIDEEIAKKAAEAAKEAAILEKAKAEHERGLAQAAEKVAAEQKDIAEKQKDIANFEKMEATKARDLAVHLQGLADDAKTKAEVARADALYSNYIAQIGLAHAYIEQNNF